jgi:hypothetical protein
MGLFATFLISFRISRLESVINLYCNNQVREGVR